MTDFMEYQRTSPLQVQQKDKRKLKKKHKYGNKLRGSLRSYHKVLIKEGI